MVFTLAGYALVAVVGIDVFNRRYVTIRRAGGEWQPDLAPVRSAAIAEHPRTVLTNTPLVLYYLSRLDPTFDRPYNLGPGRAQNCLRPCLVVEVGTADGEAPTLTPRTRPFQPGRPPMLLTPVSDAAAIRLSRLRSAGDVANVTSGHPGEEEKFGQWRRGLSGRE